MDWRAMAPGQVDWEFNPRTHTPTWQGELAWRIAASEAAREALPAPEAWRYGSDLRQEVDVYLAGPDAPMFVFVHGGAWRAGEKRDFAFLVPALIASGVSAALIGYRLAPQARVTDAAADVGRALACVAQRHSGKRVVGGHSAGAHLVACALSAPGALFAQYALLISGVYDLAPMAHTALQDVIQLSQEEIATLSPMRMHRPQAQVQFAVGASETLGFRAMTSAYAARFKPHAPITAVEGADHFSILRGFTDPKGALASSAIALCRDI
jgi:acetyl esterase/lipase